MGSELSTSCISSSSSGTTGPSHDDSHSQGYDQAYGDMEGGEWALISIGGGAAPPPSAPGADDRRVSSFGELPPHSMRAVSPGDREAEGVDADTCSLTAEEEEGDSGGSCSSVQREGRSSCSPQNSFSLSSTSPGSLAAESDAETEASSVRPGYGVREEEGGEEDVLGAMMQASFLSDLMLLQAQPDRQHSPSCTASHPTACTHSRAPAYPLRGHGAGPGRGDLARGPRTLRIEEVITREDRVRRPVASTAAYASTSTRATSAVHVDTSMPMHMHVPIATPLPFKTPARTLSPEGGVSVGAVGAEPLAVSCPPSDKSQHLLLQLDQLQRLLRRQLHPRHSHQDQQGSPRAMSVKEDYNNEEVPEGERDGDEVSSLPVRDALSSLEYEEDSQSPPQSRSMEGTTGSKEEENGAVEEDFADGLAALTASPHSFPPRSPPRAAVTSPISLSVEMTRNEEVACAEPTVTPDSRHLSSPPDVVHPTLSNAASMPASIRHPPLVLRLRPGPTTHRSSRSIARSRLAMGALSGGVAAIRRKKQRFAGCLYSTASLSSRSSVGSGIATAGGRRPRIATIPEELTRTGSMISPSSSGSSSSKEEMLEEVPMEGLEGAECAVTASPAISTSSSSADDDQEEESALEEKSDPGPAPLPEPIPISNVQSMAYEAAPGKEVGAEEAVCVSPSPRASTASMTATSSLSSPSSEACSGTSTAETESTAVSLQPPQPSVNGAAVISTHSTADSTTAAAHRGGIRAGLRSTKKALRSLVKAVMRVESKHSATTTTGPSSL